VTSKGHAADSPKPGDGSGAEQAPTVLRTLPDDRYGDFRPAGEGGMGIVYWAIDTDLNREVAFKIIRPGAAEGTTAVPDRPTAITPPPKDTPASQAFETLKQRFLQEAWITSGMAHPGIVPVYELGQTADGVPY
jgi:serine/threonine protein kinase